MIEFYKGVGGGNDFVIIRKREGLDYRKIAKKYLERSFSIGGDGLIVAEGKSMLFFNPDGNEVPFCGNGVRVLFYLLYLKGEVEKEDTILTGAGEIELKYQKDNVVSALMPDSSIEEEMDKGVIVHCGVPHLVIIVDKTENIDVDLEGRELSALLKGGNNVDWISIGSDEFSIRTYERGVNGETLSCASGIAASAFLLMERTGRKDYSAKTQGGVFNVMRNEDYKKRLLLSGDVKIIYRGEIPEKEDYWVKKGNIRKD